MCRYSQRGGSPDRADLRVTTTMKRILVADDDEHICQSLAMLLEDAGYLVEAAMDGMGALEKLLAATEVSERFDLLITDVYMPRMTGLELIDEIRRHQITLPVLIITAFCNDEMSEQLASRGCSDFIYKPFESKELLERVAGALEED